MLYLHFIIDTSSFIGAGMVLSIIDRGWCTDFGIVDFDSACDWADVTLTYGKF